jgi:hypothetical protein
LPSTSAINPHPASHRRQYVGFFSISYPKTAIEYINNEWIQ